jgi:RNA-binding protein 39
MRGFRGRSVHYFSIIYCRSLRCTFANTPSSVGYVEFKEESSVAKAIEMTGQKLKGVPIIAQLTEAEKNRASRVSEVSAASGGTGAPFHRLYVGNIHFSVSEEDLKEIFEPFGELEHVTLQRDDQNPGNRSKGYGFVQ